MDELTHTRARRCRHPAETTPAPSHEGFSGVPACPASGSGEGIVSQPLRAPQAGLRAQSVEGPRLRALSASSVRGGTRAQEISAALRCRAPPPSRAGATHTHGHTLEAGEIEDRLRSPSHTEPELVLLRRLVVVKTLRRLRRTSAAHSEFGSHPRSRGSAYSSGPGWHFVGHQGARPGWSWSRP